MIKKNENISIEGAQYNNTKQCRKLEINLENTILLTKNRLVIGDENISNIMNNYLTEIKKTLQSKARRN